MELVARICAEQQRTEMLPRALRRGETSDHEFLFLMNLDLEPVATALFLVRRPGVLGDQSFQALAFSDPIGLQPVLGEAFREEQGFGSFADYVFELVTPQRQRLASKVAAVAIEAIEERKRVAHLAALEQLEARDSFAVEGDHLAIEEQGAVAKRADRLRNRGKRRAAIVAVAREERHLRAFLIRQDAIAVVFFLVDPPGFVESFADQRRQHGKRTKGNSIALPAHLESPVAARSTSPPASRAMSASLRLLIAERGCFAVMSAVVAYSSLCLMRSQEGLLGFLPKPRVRTKTHEPWSFLPWSVNLSSPFFSAASTSATSGVHPPVSQIITVPPPYSPPGIIPSKSE